MKILVLGCVLAELIGPRGLEIDGVGENQAGERRDGAGAEKVLDFVVGLLFDPLIDGGAHAVGSGFEIDRVKSRAVVGFDQLEVGRAEIFHPSRPRARRPRSERIPGAAHSCRQAARPWPGADAPAAA